MVTGALRRKEAPNPLEFNCGVRVPTVQFDRTCTRSQRQKVGVLGHTGANSPDIFYDTEPKGRLCQVGVPLFKKPWHGRPRTGNRIADKELCTSDVMYNINWKSQDSPPKGHVRLDKISTAAADKSYPFRRPQTSIVRMACGPTGVRHKFPDEKHLACPMISKQTTREQRARVGFADKDPCSLEWHRSQRPLQVKYSCVDRRLDLFAPFSKQRARREMHPRVETPYSDYDDDEDFDGTFSDTTEARADIPKSYSAITRKLARNIFLGSASSNHSSRPSSRFHCGHYREVTEEALFPPRPRRRVSRSAGSRERDMSTTEDATRSMSRTAISLRGL